MIERGRRGRLAVMAAARAHDQCTVPRWRMEVEEVDRAEASAVGASPR